MPIAWASISILQEMQIKVHPNPSGSEQSSLDSLSQIFIFSWICTLLLRTTSIFYLALSTLCVFSFILPGESTVTPRLLSCLSVALMTLPLSTPPVSVSEATSAVSSISWYVGPSSTTNPDFKGKWSCSSEVFKRWFTWPYRKRSTWQKHDIQGLSNTKFLTTQLQIQLDGLIAYSNKEGKLRHSSDAIT